MDIPDPVAGPGEAVVKVEAVGLNFFDTLIIAGKYQTKPAFPFSPAAEFAGVVESMGPGVERVQAGDRVMGYVGYGCARERIAVKAETLVGIPDDLDFDRAAGLSITYGTTMHALKDRGKLQAGETLAVLGAAGGVGLAAVEIGKAMGARVIGCASSNEKCAFASQRGADETVNYTTTDLRDALKELTGGQGATSSMIRSEAIMRKARCARPPGGAAISWSDSPPAKFRRLPLNLVLLKGCDVVGVFWGAFTEREPAAQAANMAQIVAWCAEGKLSSHVHAIYPLADTAQALKDIAARQIMGKAILRP